MMLYLAFQGLATSTHGYVGRLIRAQSLPIRGVWLTALLRWFCYGLSICICSFAEIPFKHAIMKSTGHRSSLHFPHVGVNA